MGTVRRWRIKEVKRRRSGRGVEERDVETGVEGHAR